MANKKAISSVKKSTSSKKSTIEATAGRGGSIFKGLKSFYKSLKSTPIVGIVIAEFIGTFIITAAYFEMGGRDPQAFALVLAGVVLAFSAVSGAHVNPAMTIGAWVTRKISSLYALGYIAAQVFGATMAWLVLDTFLKSSTTATAAASPTLFHAGAIVGGKEWYLFFAELLGVTMLALGVSMAIKIKKNRTATALVAGLSILSALYVAISITIVLVTESGTGFTFLNPAIAIAANGLSWSMWPIAIYVIAPAIGGILGFVIQDFIQPKISE